IKWLGRRYFNDDTLKIRQGPDARGVFTVQYTEEKLPVPEEFRFLPFLIYEVGPDGQPQDRCTSCGICAKVCPPQCIWIVRTNDPNTGRPVPQPAEFFVDTDICMNCGLCAEFCPFDAIKMDHDYELASYERTTSHIYDKARLSKPVEYYASIRPLNYAREEEARREREARKAAKAAARG
ncbi:MAG: 4Fe-4S binding protein, partial [Chloroflexi bacterium]|nr:4Fe-4S binding protein [Chloroflexota bacterium]